MSFRRLAPVEQQPATFAFSEENQRLVDQWITKYPEGRQRSAVIAALWIGQDQEGWVTKALIEEVARILDMAVMRVLEVATFYTMFNLAPVGQYLVQVCTTTPCWLRGSDDVVAACKKHIAPAPHTISADSKFSWMEVECLGACVNAPVMQIGKDFYEDLDSPTAERIFEALRRGETPKAGPQQHHRHSSEPEGGALTLNDPKLYDGGYAREVMRRSGVDTTDAEAKKPTQGASDREAPVQKPPGAAT
ncbi:MAG: NADH-quinone oxidoreductase subunit NuoE [Alphaproteobacteria bacterium]|nr:NADH-quinone oxidoreductase subunit NuoE [Alphaproteobacteria bacterium]